MAQTIQFVATLVSQVGGPVVKAGFAVGTALREAYENAKNNKS